MSKHQADPYWTLKAMAKRNRWKQESKLPVSKSVPMTKRLTAGLKPGEFAVIGWQHAPVRMPARLQRVLASNATKGIKRERYERRFKRLAKQVSPATPALLDRAVDAVLAYRPKPKSDAGKARARKARKVAKAQS